MRDPGALTTGEADLYSCSASQIPDVITNLCKEDGRLEMAYAWSKPSNTELRYLINHSDSQRFSIVAVPTEGEALSLSHKYPLLGWYEREIQDLYPIRFIDHPDPSPMITAIASDDESLDVDGQDIQRLPFGPVRADVVESAEFTFYYAGEAIIHYHPRLFFKHRGVETRFEGLDTQQGVVLAERV